jgi:hypothetical protein
MTGGKASGCGAKCAYGGRGQIQLLVEGAVRQIDGRRAAMVSPCSRVAGQQVFGAGIQDQAGTQTSPCPSAAPIRQHGPRR